MLGSLTVGLYLVSRCVNLIMGQVLTRLAPDWLSGAVAPADKDGRDECGYRLHAPSPAVRHVSLHPDEEMVIRETREPERAANGVLTPPRAEALLVEHHARLPEPAEEPSIEPAAEPMVQAAVEPIIESVVKPLAAATIATETGAARPSVKRSLHAANDHLPPGTEAPSGEPEPKRRLPGEFETLIRSDYPFLDDPETVDYLRTSKVMFVMKGLPGSGKTHLAGRIAQTYPGAVICSADDFFMKDGRYQFDREQLPAAHESCQRRAEQACLDQRGHIVIDNSNLRNWEYSAYAKLAARHQYLLLLQEPQTAWRRDPARLAAYNCHQVQEADLRKKLKSLQAGTPLYYGWFLNAADCRELLDRVKGTLQSLCQSCDTFREEVSIMTGGGDIAALESVYRPPAELLHVTARFCGGRARAAAARQYSERPEVRRALNSLSTARVTALLLTPRTLSARVTLGSDQLTVWDQPDRETGPPPPPRDRDQNRETRWQTGPSQPSLAVSGSKRPPRRAAGRRAHITLGCRSGWAPVTVGFDLLEVLDRLEAEPSLLERPLARAGRAAVHRLEEGVWYVDLDRDWVVDVVFSGRF